MKKTLLITLCLLAFSFANAQSLWQKANETQASQSGKKQRTSIPAKQLYYKLDLDGLKSALQNAPVRGQQSNLVIAFPDSDGRLQQFRIWEAPVMHPDLAAKYPDNKSYVGQGVENRSTIIRFSVNLFGLHAMTLAANDGTYYIDPYSSDGQYYTVY